MQERLKIPDSSTMCNAFIFLRIIRIAIVVKVDENLRSTA